MKRLVRAPDFWICLALAACTIAYLRTWPHDFLQADEGTFLYEAKRVLNGDVIYRDFFDVIMPTTIYLMAGAFALFGTSIDVARGAMAVVHAGIVVLVYVLCRCCAVRRTFAVAAALAHVAIAYPAFSIATPHWFGTLATLALLYRALRLEWPPSWAGCLRLGILSGVLFALQHQRGIVTGAGVALLIVGLHVWRRSWRNAIGALGAYSLGVGLIVVPLLLAIAVGSGPRAAFTALVIHPLTYYREYNQTWWGQYHTGWVYVRYYVYPEFIRWLPLVIPAVLLFVAWCVARRRLTLTIVRVGLCAYIGATGIAAVSYFPDHGHLALLAPLCFVLVAAIANGGVAAVRGDRSRAGLVFDGLAAVFCVWLAQRAQFNIGERLYYHPYPHETAFGHIDFRFEPEIGLVDSVRAAANSAKGRELFCYTACAGLYLTSDTINPTPYELMIPGYNRPDQFDDVVRIFDERQVDLVVSIPTGIKKKGIRDPINAYLRTNFELVAGDSPTLMHRLWRRRASADAPD